MLTPNETAMAILKTFGILFMTALTCRAVLSGILWIRILATALKPRDGRTYWTYNGARWVVINGWKISKGELNTGTDGLIC